MPHQPARHPHVPRRKQEVGPPGHGEPEEESDSSHLGPQTGSQGHSHAQTYIFSGGWGRRGTRGCCCVRFF